MTADRVLCGAGFLSQEGLLPSVGLYRNRIFKKNMKHLKTNIKRV